MYQRTELIGHLGQEPEMRYTPSGQAVTNFSVATTNTYTNKDGDRVKETMWVRVSVWGAMAEACKKYLEKGSLVFVAGRIQVDKKTGNPRVYEKKSGDWTSTLEINASEVKFLSGQGSGKTAHQEEEEEDLPEYMRD